MRSSDFYEGPRLVDTSRTYTVATSDFLTTPESSYPMLAQGEIQRLSVPVREVLENYLAEKVLDKAEQGAR
jgi:2',3'-cyclic-nucleotide 2'-phosphodiesterase (5'-nucleotidase family)